MTIDGHIINTELLTEGGWILDAGCRHFKLSKSLNLYSSFHLIERFKFLCLDPDPIIEPPSNVIFLPIALATEEGKANYCGWSTGEGNYIYKNQKPHYATLDIHVQTRTIKSLMEQYSITQFELAKLDIEGSEYDIFLNINFAFAKQIAVEFHQCLGYNQYGTHDQYMQKLMNAQFGQIYRVADWKETQQGLYEYNFQLKSL